jgi:uncharacterized damage-inducible protein DinB
MRIVDPILAELDQEAATTRRLLERVPSHKLAWTPHPKSMTLGQLALHIAQVPGTIAGFVAGPVFEMRGDFKQAAAASTAEVLSTLEQSLTKAKEILNGLDDATITSMWTMKSGGKAIMSMPRIAVVRSILLNHWYQHRGQLSVYLRELDVPLPSIYGPSADESPFR